MSKKAKRREEARLQQAQQRSPATPESSTHHAPHAKSGFDAGRFFDANYRKLMIVPTLLLLFAFSQIGWQIATTGDFVAKSVSLSGGVQITILQEGIDTVALEEALRTALPDGRVRVAEMVRGSGIVVNARFTEGDLVEQLKHEIGAGIGGLPEGRYTIEIVGASLGDSFFRQTMIALAIAFAFMSLVVFISFRSLAPSLFVVLAAFSDIITTLAIFNFVGYELTTAGIAAFLMLIGYSIDTDVMLSSRVLRRREGSITQATVNAIGTGLTMSGTTIGATLVAFFLTKSEVLQQIMFIILIGVAVDLIYTWMYNAPILKWYLEREVPRG